MDHALLGKIIGNLLRKRRMELNYTQLDVCKAASISQGQLSRIENGLRIPSLALLLDICKKLNWNFNIGDITKFLSDDKSSEKKEENREKAEKEGSNEDGEDAEEPV